MPLDFNKPPPDQTLGKAKTKEELKRRIKIKRKDVRKGLLDQGGFAAALTSEELGRRDEYKKLIERQTEEARAQFGDLPQGWSYTSYVEVEEAVRARVNDHQAVVITNRRPQIAIDRDEPRMAFSITLLAGEHKLGLRLDDEYFRSIDGIQRFVYELNYAIRKMAREMIFAPTTQYYYDENNYKLNKEDKKKSYGTSSYDTNTFSNHTIGSINKYYAENMGKKT